MKSPFWHYNCAFFDPIELINKYTLNSQISADSYYTNSFGVLINPKYFPGILDGKEGTIENTPLPANFHTDISELGACFRAIELSGNSFVMVELGCGWGCWMNITGKIAKKLDKKIKLIGVEGDDGHIKFAKESLGVNGFKNDEYELIKGIASSSRGFALFPRQNLPGEKYGLEPKFNVTEDESKKLISSGCYDKLKMHSIKDIAENYEQLDLVHIDIQGGELKLISEGIEDFNKKVAYLVIGTHSREIEGRLIEILLRNNWILEIERPAILGLENSSPIVLVDGVQGWRNRGYIRSENGFELLKSGWSTIEDQFVWSTGKKSIITIPSNKNIRNKDLTVIIKGFPFLTKNLKKQDYEFVANGVSIKKGTLFEKKEFKLEINKEINDKESLEIELKLPDCDSPQNQGLSNDSRMLGFALTTVKIIS